MNQIIRPTEARNHTTKMTLLTALFGMLPMKYAPIHETDQIATGTKSARVSLAAYCT